ncbi:hypothetical protein [Acidovorax radicis]|uniref:hypothetical protein n=1 Tax=Acidovorax radicis TaxID=758826 RepID=UPI001CFBFE5A|nr:hypothetical protein [Acidovorax radicis]UCV00317.1 hypothetical protein KI609_05905 [Acidovorax radicis]
MKAHALNNSIPDIALDSVLRAASGEFVALPPDLACRLLACGTDAELAGSLGLGLHQRIRVRNEALVDAAQVLSADGCSTWQAAQRLAQAVRRFERALLPALRAGAELDLAPHEAALWRAYMVRGAKPLRNPGKLYQLLQLSK